MLNKVSGCNSCRGSGNRTGHFQSLLQTQQIVGELLFLHRFTIDCHRSALLCLTLIIPGGESTAKFTLLMRRTKGCQWVLDPTGSPLVFNPQHL
jgi:glutamine amidotransferase PdxT